MHNSLYSLQFNRHARYLRTKTHITEYVHGVGPTVQYSDCEETKGTQKLYSPNLSKSDCMSDVARICSIITIHLSKL